MNVEEKKRFENMEERLSEIDGKVDEILTALRGDNLGTSAGLVQEFKDIKTRVRKLETLKNKMIWTAIGAGIAGGLSLSKLVEWIQESAK